MMTIMKMTKEQRAYQNRLTEYILSLPPKQDSVEVDNSVTTEDSVVKQKVGRPRKRPLFYYEPNAPKRGRGRPRTRPLPDPNAPKRGRGRPRLTPVLESSTTPKRGRGRPRTRPLPDPHTPKKGRGRPKKVLETTTAALDIV